MTEKQECPRCGGSGFQGEDEKCLACDGGGAVEAKPQPKPAVELEAKPDSPSPLDTPSDNPWALQESDVGRMVPASLTPSAARAVEMAKARVQAALTVAMANPRRPNVAFDELMQSCKVPKFAEKGTYSFQRGGQDIEGPSVYLAREAARCWGNIQYGAEIMEDYDDKRVLRCWAWDYQSNATTERIVLFRKVHQRKDRQTGTTREVPIESERDLRELTEKTSALGVRNCVLELLPPHFIAIAMDECHATERAFAQKTLKMGRKELALVLISDFGAFGVTADMLERYLGHPLDEIGEEELVKLRGIRRALKDGAATREEYFTHTGGTGRSAADILGKEEAP